ncbi:MAG: hypothetical protein IPJ30_12620 [Acidobacteria bacterium]|nr:hypothetical protein [Acidobacteriota bacterium]
MKKLYATKRIGLDSQFIAFYKLNVPIIAAAHLGNPIVERTRDLEAMLGQCHLDSLKLTIQKELLRRHQVSIPEIDSGSLEDEGLLYFPFGEIERSEPADEELVRLYAPWGRRSNLDLLKLYLSHEINTLMSDVKEVAWKEAYENEPRKFVEEIVRRISFEEDEPRRIRASLLKFFVLADDVDSEARSKDVELEIVEDLIVKILSRPPFTYYRNIFLSVFDYCIDRLEAILDDPTVAILSDFPSFRKAKFYLRRSVDLNSNFMVSRKFLIFVRDNYRGEVIEKAMTGLARAEERVRKLRGEGKISNRYGKAVENNVRFKRAQIDSFLSYLLFYFKELVYKDPARSIALERLINHEVHPITCQSSGKVEVAKVIADPYFQFTGMLKAENLCPLSELKKYHKRRTAEGEIGEQRDYRRHYLRPNLKNDPVILNAQKFVRYSRHRSLKAMNDAFGNIRSSLASMLKTVDVLEMKRNSGMKPSLDAEVRRVLDAAIGIISSGIPETDLKYYFFVRGENSPGTDSIFSISSADPPDRPSSIRPRKDGLIFNLLNGLFEDPDLQRPQTFLMLGRNQDGSILSFKQNYYRRSGKPVSLEKLFENDRYNPSTRLGIKGIDGDNMFMMFRFANFPTDVSNGAKDQGLSRAVLLLANSSKITPFAFRNFMNNEKVRLLLLIKEEITAYLQRNFDNAAFVELLENRKTINLQRTLRHEQGGFLDALDVLMNDLSGRAIDDDDRLCFPGTVGYDACTASRTHL